MGRLGLSIVTALLLCVPTLGTAGSIVRGDKASGGTAFVSGWIAEPSEVNTDFDTIYNEFNGNIENVNIKATAAILPSKLNQTAAAGADAATSGLDADIVDDYSATDAEADNSSDPGTADDNTLATNLQEEIAQLRYKIEELTVGTSASAVAASGSTDTDAHWVDGPFRSGNLIYNGGFDIWTAAANAAGDGWALEQGPDTAWTELTETDGYGDGAGMLITANGEALGGIYQNVSGLKAGATYLATVSVKETAGDTCRLFVEDADTNDLTVNSDAVGDWEVLSGTFQVDAVPNAVKFQLLAVTDGDICLFDHVGLFEINTDPVPIPMTVVGYDVSTAAQSIDPGPEVIDGLSLTVIVPRSNCIITVDYAGTFLDEAGGQVGALTEVELLENVDGGGANPVGKSAQGWSQTNVAFTDFPGTLNLHYVLTEPVPGSDYVYTVRATATGDDVDVVVGAGPPAYGSELYTELACSGGG